MIVGGGKGGDGDGWVECFMESGLEEGMVCGFDSFLLNWVSLFEFVLLLLLLLLLLLVVIICISLLFVVLFFSLS